VTISLKNALYYDTHIIASFIQAVFNKNKNNYEYLISFVTSARG